MIGRDSGGSRVVKKRNLSRITILAVFAVSALLVLSLAGTAAGEHTAIMNIFTRIL